MVVLTTLPRCQLQWSHCHTQKVGYHTLSDKWITNNNCLKNFKNFKIISLDNLNLINQIYLNFLILSLYLLLYLYSYILILSIYLILF